MEKVVVYEDNMETAAGDFMNLQNYADQTVNDIIKDAVDAGNAYTGMAISKAAPTQVSINPGRLYWGGVVYLLEDPVVIDFQTVPGAMPVVQKRQIAIAVSGQTLLDDVQPRNFVVDSDTGASNTESVALTKARVVQVAPITGVEAINPNVPSTPATQLQIGTVLLSPTGVVSVQQNYNNQLPNLTAVDFQMQALSAFQGFANGEISTLQTGLAALALQLAGDLTKDQFQKLADLVNQIWQIVNRPPAFALDTIDNFVDTSQSAVGTNVDGAYSAIVAEGLRFGSGATWTGKLALNNPTEPAIQAWDTFILPKPSGMRVRMDCSFPSFDWVAERILDHAYWVFNPRQCYWARTRYRCGPWYQPCPQPAVWQWEGLLDPVYCNLRFDGVVPGCPVDTWAGVPCNTLVKYPEGDWDWPRYIPNRCLNYWLDDVDIYYWSKVNHVHNFSHNHYGQSFLNSQDGWLGGITVFSMVPEYYQPLTLLIMRCDDHGVPDHQQTIARLDLDATTIQTCYGTPIRAGDIVSSLAVSVGTVVAPTNVPPTAYGYPGATSQWAGYVVGTDQTQSYWNVYYPEQRLPVYAYPVRLTFTPVFLEAGKRYSFHLLSTYDHQFACATDHACYSIHGGDFWDYDGSFWFRVAQTPKTLRFMLHYLVWSQWGNQQSPGGTLHYPVLLQPLQLAGGIQAIDVLADHIVPYATDLTYSIQIGGQWQAFAGDPDTPVLSSNPALLPFRINFTGTADCMPGVSLTNSQVKLIGPALSSYHHISTNIPRGGATATGVKVMATVTGFTAHHTLNCSIHYATTHLLPNGTTPMTQTVLADGVTTQFTWNFNATGVSNYQVELDGSTDGTGKNFVVSQRAAFSA